jgi:hypothetical protein
MASVLYILNVGIAISPTSRQLADFKLSLPTFIGQLSRVKLFAVLYHTDVGCLNII